MTGAPNQIARNVMTAGTPPMTATGGEPALKARLAIMNAQREAAGGSPLQQALDRMRLSNTQSEMSHRTWEETTREQDRMDAKRQAEEDKKQAAWEKQNTDYPERLKKDVNAAYPGMYNDFETTLSSGVDPSTLRGSINKDGSWVPDPNGPLITSSPPAAPHPGIFGSPIGEDKGSAPSKTMPFTAFKSYAQRYSDIQGAPGNRYVPPRPDASTTPGGGGGGGTGGAPTGGSKRFNSPAELGSAIRAGTVKKGDVVQTPNGPMTVK